MVRHGAILLIGPTASGKTPLGDCLAERGLWNRPCAHFDFGARLRSVAERPEDAAYLAPEDVDFIRKVLDSGALLEDEHFRIARAILERFVAEVPEGTIVVLNGLPRHCGQARDVESIVDVVCVAELICSPEAVLERIRRDTGGDRAERADDDVVSVRHKLAIYAKRTAPLLDHYRRRNVPIRRLPVGADTDAADLQRLLNAEGTRP